MHGNSNIRFWMSFVIKRLTLSLLIRLQVVTVTLHLNWQCPTPHTVILGYLGFMSFQCSIYIYLCVCVCVCVCVSVCVCVCGAGPSGRAV